MRELFRRARVLQGAQRADPLGEVAVVVSAREMGELEMRVDVDEAGDERAIGELELPRLRWPGDVRLGADGGEDATLVNENGAVLDGRRRDGVHGARTNAEHVR